MRVPFNCDSNRNIYMGKGKNQSVPNQLILQLKTCTHNAYHTAPLISMWYSLCLVWKALIWYKEDMKCIFPNLRSRELNWLWLPPIQCDLNFNLKLEAYEKLFTIYFIARSFFNWLDIRIFIYFQVLEPSPWFYLYPNNMMKSIDFFFSPLRGR